MASFTLSVGFSKYCNNYQSNNCTELKHNTESCDVVVHLLESFEREGAGGQSGEYVSILNERVDI